MTVSLHLAAGAATGVAIQKYLPPDVSLPERAFCAFVAGLLSHIFLDAFPHQEYSSGGRVLWAFILGETGLVFALVLLPVDNFVAGAIIFFGMAGGALPDVLELLYTYFFRQEWLASLSAICHLGVHGMVPLSFRVNFWWQSLTAFIFALFVIFKSI